MWILFCRYTYGFFFFIDLCSGFFIEERSRCVVRFYICNPTYYSKMFLLYPTEGPAIPWYRGCLTTCVQPSTGASTGAPRPLWSLYVRPLWQTRWVEPKKGRVYQGLTFVLLLIHVMVHINICEPHYEMLPHIIKQGPFLLKYMTTTCKHR